MEPTHQAGFTLVELMITLVILGVLVAIAAPTMFSTVESRKLHGAVERAFADFQFVKTEAIKRNSFVRLDFNGFGAGNNWCYGFKVNADCDCTITDPTNVLFCEIDGVAQRVTQDTYDGAVSVIAAATPFAGVASFSPIRGTTSAGSLILGLSDGRTARIVVSPIGRIRICSNSIGGYRTC
jgi:type IV fimbrial biogenesis protein FimT